MDCPAVQANVAILIKRQSKKLTRHLGNRAHDDDRNPLPLSVKSSDFSFRCQLDFRKLRIILPVYVFRFVDVPRIRVQPGCVNCIHRSPSEDILSRSPVAVVLPRGDGVVLCVCSESLVRQERVCGIVEALPNHSPCLSLVARVQNDGTGHIQLHDKCSPELHQTWLGSVLRMMKSQFSFVNV